MENFIINTDQLLKEAIINKDQVKVSLYRQIKTYMKNYMVANKLNVLSEADIEKVLKKILKEIEEEISLYKTVENSQEKLNILNEQKNILVEILPKALSEEDMQKICKDLVIQYPNEKIGFYMGKLKDIKGIDKAFCSKFFATL